MKNKNLLLIIALFFASLTVLGQAPNKIDFQAMARDASSNPIVMQTIGVRISIIEGGSTVYTERHTPQTDDYGLFNIHIGDGSPLSGNFNNIDWSLGNHAVKVEVDPNGGYVYVNMGTSQLTSTPYSLYGEDDDADPANELQTLSIVGNDLTISDGNTITLPGGGGGSLWTQNGDDIYYDAGKVGIGVSNPGYPLHVKDNFENWLVGIHNQSTSAGAHGLVARADGGDPFLVQNNSGDLLVVKNNGNVGIGTSSPQADLHVEDHIRIGEDPSHPTVYGELSHEGSGNGFKINAHAGGGTWADIHLQTNGSTKVLIESSGKVGIGTTSPEAKLEVNGTTKLGNAGVVISEIREITGTTSSIGILTFVYPIGYNKSNTRVLSLEIYYNNLTWRSMGSAQSSTPGVNVSCGLSTDLITLNYPDVSAYHNKPFRMVIMKIE